MTNFKIITYETRALRMAHRMQNKGCVVGSVGKLGSCDRFRTISRCCCPPLQRHQCSYSSRQKRSKSTRRNLKKKKTLGEMLACSRNSQAALCTSSAAWCNYYCCEHILWSCCGCAGTHHSRNAKASASEEQELENDADTSEDKTHLKWKRRRHRCQSWCRRKDSCYQNIFFSS